MKFKSIILLAVAVGCGLVAMLGVQQALSNKQEGGEEMGMVLVAVTDIKPGFPLDDSNVTFKTQPLSAIPEGAVTKLEQYENRALKSPSLQGEMIMVGKLGEPGEIGGSIEIPMGFRVESVQVNATKTHSGLILPGDYVDVVVTYDHRTANGMVKKAKTVLERIQVFQTDNVRRSDVGSGTSDVDAKNISVLVTPKQGLILMLAQQKGQITLSLRNPGDETTTELGQVDDSMFEEFDSELGEYPVEEMMAEGESSVETGDVRSFLNEQGQLTTAPVAAPAAPEKPTWTIKIYEGDTVREEKVDLPEEVVSKPIEVPAPTASGKSTEFKGWLNQMWTTGV